MEIKIIGKKYEEIDHEIKIESLEQLIEEISKLFDGKSMVSVVKNIRINAPGKYKITKK